MPSATVVGSALTFGLAAEESSLTTQSVSVSNKADKKEARDKQGVIVAVAYYNKTSEISIEGIGSFSNPVTNIGTSLALSGTFDVAGSIFIDEVSIDHSNEEFVSTSISATSYEGITS